MIKDLKAFKYRLEKIDIQKTQAIDKFINEIDINQDNYSNWENDIYSDEIIGVDLEKLPQIIDRLFASNDKILFMLSLMLIEATFMELPYITPLENYPMFKEKFKLLKGTLIYIYSCSFNPASDCMTMILLNNDPKAKLFTAKEKELLKESTNTKIKYILDYCKGKKKIEQKAFNDLAVLIDLACYINNDETTKIIKSVEKIPLDFECKLFLAKYKAVNNTKITKKEFDELLNNEDEIQRVVMVFENIGKINLLPLTKISQEKIAKSEMITWLKYPTELGKAPAEIDLIDTFIYNKKTCYIYKFKKNKSDKSFLIGIAGGYTKNKLTAQNSGLTFSLFEKLEKDYLNQAIKIADFITDAFNNK